MRGNLMFQDLQGCHKVVILREKCFSFISQAPEIISHRDIFSMLSNPWKRFWWPTLDKDVKWFISTSHPCQTQQTHHLHLPPTIHNIPTLFQKVHINTMFMLTVPCLGPSDMVFGRKMKILLETLYSIISSAKGW